ncbi:MAG: tRNA (adenosine(37)-N6)-threonylcarbamoyltransferase complex ATPase subunit type 1 TsaE [Synergistes sp.]|nr:tRNA (adenosine(37)-N6)-threonylcarbamoyltransferase complex ATPase subunit type 1 TsaE [Synergistes sp.]
MKFLSFSEDSITIISENDSETFAAGQALGEAAFPGLLILLKGTLGMGKTRLTQGIGAALGISRVKSPTFIIMSEHNGKLPLLHADLYRLEDESEIDALGIEECLDDGFVGVVEWAERWGSVRESERIDVEFSPVSESDDARLLKITCLGESPRAAFQKFSKKIESMRCEQ